MQLKHLSLCFLATIFSLVSAGSDCSDLIVTTGSGIFTGTINKDAPNVRQFLSIPFAKPPVNNLRWLPPQKPTCKKTDKIDATKFPSSCPQYASNTPTIYNTILPQLAINMKGQNATAGASAEATSEDCLYLAVWSPTTPETKQPLPVLIFMTGGAFVSGGINCDAQLPHHWVQRTQSHIVVTINYRLDIFGFPNAAGLNTQNLGLLDQRMALEWVRDNIEAFGGDPQRITLWGQSAGAGSAGIHSFAYAEDPIANGYFLESGGAYQPAPDPNPYTNFSYVAAHFGCDAGSNHTRELECLRKIPFDAIEDYLVEYFDNSTMPALNFLPIVDEKIVFSNLTARYIMGAGQGYADRAVMTCSTSNEVASLVPLPENYTVAGPDPELEAAISLALNPCSESETSHLRSQYASSSKTGLGGITYRSKYFGNFSNVSPYFWMGAYHSSDVPMWFGSHQDLKGPKSTKEEFATSYSMQDHLLAFAEDPVNGPEKSGWKPYNQGGLVEFGKKNDQGSVTVVQYVDVKAFDKTCNDTVTPP